MECRRGIRRTQVVVFQSYPSVPGQVRVPDGDGFEPAGEGFGGADVAGERWTEWAEDGHRLWVVEGMCGGERCGKWVKWDSSVPSGLPDRFSEVSLVWTYLDGASSTAGNPAFRKQTVRLGS